MYSAISASWINFNKLTVIWFKMCKSIHSLMFFLHFLLLSFSPSYDWVPPRDPFSSNCSDTHTHLHIQDLSYKNKTAPILVERERGNEQLFAREREFWVYRRKKARLCNRITVLSRHKQSHPPTTERDKHRPEREREISVSLCFRKRDQNRRVPPKSYAQNN